MKEHSLKAIKNIMFVFLLLAIYVLASVDFHSGTTNHFYNKGDTRDWFNLDDSKNHFDHSLPSEQTIGVEVVSFHPSNGDKDNLSAVQVAHIHYFNNLLTKQIYKALHSSITQRKMDLLYPFHSFF